MLSGVPNRLQCVKRRENLQGTPIKHVLATFCFMLLNSPDASGL